LILVLIIISYIGLQAAKNGLQSKAREQADFKAGETPDLVKDNKAKEEAQTKIDRVGAAEGNNQTDETKPLEADTTQFVRFLMSDAYKKTQYNEEGCNCKTRYYQDYREK
jgi:hypothetical protein